MKWILAFLLLAYGVPAPAQTASGEWLNWSVSRPLKWSDYRGNPDERSDAAATTVTYISIDYRMRDSRMSWKIECRFSHDRSWGRHKDAHILSHEQGHFDIAEIHARLLEKAMRAYVFDKKNYRRDLDRIYRQVMNEKEEMQNQYDRETRHSIDKEKQAEWLLRISRLLKETEAFADY